MAKIKEMGEGIVVEDAPAHRTTIDAVMAKGKRGVTNGNALHIYPFLGLHPDKMCLLFYFPHI